MSKPAVIALVLMLGIAVGCGPAESPAPDSSAAAALPADQVEARATEILRKPDPVGRIRELSALLETLTPDAAPALVAAFDAAPLDGGDPELVLFGMWWAQFDPEAAYLWSSTDWRAQFGSVIAAIFRGWAHKDPQRAMEKARAVRFPFQRQLAVDAAFAGWDESNGAGLMEMVATLQSTDQQRIGEILARRRVVSLGPMQAIEWAEALPDPAFREMMTLRVAGAAAGVKGAASQVAAWARPQIEGNDTDRPTGLPRRIATRWIMHDPEAAMAWLRDLPEGYDRDDGVAEAFRDWMRRDPDAAFEWAKRVDVQTWNEPAMAVYARALSREHPRDALALVSRFTTKPLRDSTEIIVLRVWLEHDRPAAEAWLDENDFPEDRRKLAMAVGATPRRARLKAQAEAAQAGAADPAGASGQIEPPATPAN